MKDAVRLSDGMLDAIEHLDKNESRRHSVASPGEVRSMLAELRAARAQALSEEEIADLEWLAQWLRWGPSRTLSRVPPALAALDKLITQARSSR